MKRRCLSTRLDRESRCFPKESAIVCPRYSDQEMKEINEILGFVTSLKDSSMNQRIKKLSKELLVPWYPWFRLVREYVQGFQGSRIIARRNVTWKQGSWSWKTQTIRNPGSFIFPCFSTILSYRLIGSQEKTWMLRNERSINMLSFRKWMPECLSDEL